MNAKRSALLDLLDIMARLRDPETGCPWDREQTFSTIAPYTIEEAYEVADAVESGDRERLRDELGDLLFQVVFHARMAEEQSWFDFDSIAAAIRDKLVRRHPHVFESADTGPANELNRRWEDLKEQERKASAQRRGGESSVLSDVPLALPALLRAAKLGKRASRVGFDWPDATGVREKIDEELGELEEALAASASQKERISQRPADAAAGSLTVGAEPPASASDEANAAIAEEFGDVLFSLVNWGRHLDINAEEALRAANAKFERRFGQVERLAAERGLALRELTPMQWEALWTEVKSASRAVQ